MLVSALLPAERFGVEEFLQDTCIGGEDLFEETSSLYKRYWEWCREKEVTPCRWLRDFEQSLVELGFLLDGSYTRGLYLRKGPLL